MQAPILASEAERLAALYTYDILDKPREEEFEEITRLIAQICDAPKATITLIDRDRQWFVSEVGMGMRETPRDVAVCAHAILQPDLFIVPDMREDIRFADNPAVMGDPYLRFYAGSPLRTPDGQTLGTLCVMDYNPRTLTEAQKGALRVLAGQVVKQLELRRLLREQANVLAEKEAAQVTLAAAYAHEKKIAETLQRSLLMPSEEMDFPGLNVSPLYESAWSEADVGGDFYDAFALGAGKVALVVGDVAGKGLDAAARTAEVKYTLRALLLDVLDPAAALGRLNDFLCRFHDYASEDRPRFVVMALGIVDTLTGEATFSFAGSEPVLVMRKSGATEQKTLPGLPLGVQSGEYYQTLTWQMEAGDILMLATDGLAEARRGSDFLGVEGLSEIAAAQSQRENSLGEVGAAIMRETKDFAGGSLRDDACLLLAQRSGKEM